MWLRRLLISLICILFLLPLLADDKPQTLSFLYIGTPPYVFSINGEMDGVFIEPVEKTLGRVGLVVDWVRMAPNRGFRLFEADERPFCVVSQAEYYENDRNRNWYVSDSFANLGNLGLLVRQDEHAEMEKVGNLKTLVEVSSYRGGFLRLSLEKHQSDLSLNIDPKKHLIVDANPFKMGQLVARGRIDFILASAKAVAVHKSFYDEIAPLSFLEIDGIPQRPRPINIICNRAVPKGTLLKIDRAIAQNIKKPPK